MPATPPLGATWIVTLECLGTLPGPRFLDGRTHDGSVGLVDLPEPPFTGTRWALTTLAAGVVMLESLGQLDGPRFLDGRTHRNEVGLAPFITPPFSGARWKAVEVEPGVITLECRGEAPGNRFLDGRTGQQDVWLAPATGGQFTGTRWRVHLEGELVTLQCLGDLPGVRFLDGRTHDGTVGLAPTTADPFTGTSWEMSAVAGGVTFKSLGDLDGPRFLDGRTHEGTVGLAPHTGEPFSGTRWRVDPLAGGTIALRCLGALEGRARFLDGRTHEGTVGLAENTAAPYTGTRWRLASSSIVLGPETPGADDVLAVHAALLHTGKVIYFGGDEHDRLQHERGDVKHTRLFDTQTFLIRPAESPAFDAFCCGHAMLADGRLLIAGGTEKFLLDDQHDAPRTHHHEHFPGLHTCAIFDPSVETWKRAAPMVSSGLPDEYRNGQPGNPGGRWYPSLVTLGTGEVLAVAGHPSDADSRHSHHIPERFYPPTPPGPWSVLRPSMWTLLPIVPTLDAFESSGSPNVYPRIHLLPNGRVFCSTPLGVVPQSQTIDPFTNARFHAAPPPPDRLNIGTFFSQDGTSVLLPLLPSENYRVRVLLLGGVGPVILDLTSGTQHWAWTAPRQLPAAPPRNVGSNPHRFHLDAVLLPTGDVFVCGGCGEFRSDEHAVLEPELYHPALEGQRDRWESLPAARVARNYHSVSLLLPDGRIWTAGSNHDGRQGHENLEPRIEVVNPPYVGRAGRPIIDEAVPTASVQARFPVRTRQARSISRIAMVRAGSVTHAFNSDQRYVGLEFAAVSDTELAAVAPPNHDIAPPGYYLLFVVDQEGRPSEGKFIRLTC